MPKSKKKLTKASDLTEVDNESSTVNIMTTSSLLPAKTKRKPRRKKPLCMVKNRHRRNKSATATTTTGVILNAERADALTALHNATLQSLLAPSPGQSPPPAKGARNVRLPLPSSSATNSAELPLPPANMPMSGLPGESPNVPQVRPTMGETVKLLRDWVKGLVKGEKEKKEELTNRLKNLEGNRQEQVPKMAFLLTKKEYDTSVSLTP